jgi:hypothetical protein
MKFWNVAKANLEIERLESELKAKDEQIKILSENPAVIEKAAEDMRIELEASKAQAAKLAGDNGKLIAENAKLTLDLEGSTKRLAELPNQVKVEAAKQAVQISAAQGIPPLPVAPANPIAPDPLAGLTGRERIQASFKQQILRNKR